eukprot:TRINITY_DN704_c0_g2_i4.p2 TRINITY_DN704_c0_g2~~TRINITY_DN704_c0_g2_i4.p2  ORF type:complete len:158 (-),score=15.80 TRINITY_DN704_c0_g2_i4:342-815(-)
MSGPQGAGYYKDDGEDHPPASPAQMISQHKRVVFAPREAPVVTSPHGRRSTLISPIKQVTTRPAVRKARPVSAHPATGQRAARPVSAHPATGQRATRPDVPALELGGTAIRPTGFQGLGLNQPKARPRSAAVSRATRATGGAWRSSQARGSGTTSLW